MRYPVDNFKTLWRSAFGFGESTDYGFHEAEDLNLRTAGNSDLGQKLFAISDGTIKSVHSHAGIPTFGKHLFLEIKGKWGTRWAHYSHCDNIYVKTGDTVKEGDLVATVGLSGTTSAHCHFAIVKKWTQEDNVANSKPELDNWESPFEFIEKYIKESEVTPVDKIDYKSIWDKTGDKLPNRAIAKDTYFTPDDMKKLYQDPTTGTVYVTVTADSINHYMSLYRDLLDKAPEVQIIEVEKIVEKPVEVIKEVIKTVEVPVYQPIGQTTVLGALGALFDAFKRLIS